MCSAGAVLPDQQGKPRKQEVTAGVVDHIDLAGIKARLERGQRHIQLEDGGLSLARIQIGQLDQRTLVGFGLPLKERDVGQEPDAGFVPSLAQLPRIRGIRRSRPRRIVDFIIKKQVLRRRENMRDVRDDFRTIVNQRIQVGTLSLPV